MTLDATVLHETDRLLCLSPYSLHNLRCRSNSPSTSTQKSFKCMEAPNKYLNLFGILNHFYAAPRFFVLPSWPHGYGPYYRIIVIVAVFRKFGWVRLQLVKNCRQPRQSGTTGTRQVIICWHPSDIAVIFWWPWWFIGVKVHLPSDVLVRVPEVHL
jgi:hypothetical protein